MSLSRILYEVRKQKAKYFSKLLSEDARYTNLLINLNLLDLFSDETWEYLDLYLNLSLSLSWELKLPPIDFENIELDFKVDLPNLEEILQGIWIKFEKINFAELLRLLFEETFNEIYKKIKESLENFDNLINRNIKPPHGKYIRRTSVSKAIYGKSRFGSSYYDPQALYEFYTSTLVGFFKNRTSYEALKQIIDNAMNTLNIHEPIGKHLYNRFVMISEALKQNFVLGYGVLNKSMLIPKDRAKETLYFVDYDGRVLKVNYSNLFGLHAGFLLDVSILDYNYLMPRENPYKYPDPPVILSISVKASRASNRFTLMWVGASNYVKTEEMKDFRRCDRADQYMQLQVLRYFLESVVKEVLEPMGLPPTTLRQYKNALIQLLGLRYKRHRWGYKAFPTMTDDELKNWWVNYWVRQGLNANLLNILWDSLWSVLKEVGKQKLYLGKVIQERRKYLAKLLS